MVKEIFWRAGKLFYVGADLPETFAYGIEKLNRGHINFRHIDSFVMQTGRFAFKK